MKKTLRALAGAACLLSSMSAQAALYKLEFAATDFFAPFSDMRAPQERVAGSILFQAASLGAEVTSIDGIDLVIGGHRYAVGEIGSQSAFYGHYLFGGTVNGVNGASSWTNDFFFSGFTGGGSAMFAYAQADNTSTWISYKVDARYAEQLAEVPEPGSLALLLGAVGAFGLARRRTRAAT